MKLRINAGDNSPTPAEDKAIEDAKQIHHPS